MLLDQLKTVKGFKEATHTICDMEILFREPTIAAMSEARKNFLKFRNVTGQKDPEINYTTSDFDKYNRALVVNTAIDPVEGKPLFGSNAEYDSVFGKAGNCGEIVLTEFLKAAKTVMKAADKKKIYGEGDEPEGEDTEGNE